MSNIQKFMFDSLPIKGVIVSLDDVWLTISQQKNYPQAIRRILGELLVANTLLTANIKIKGKVICQIQGNPKFNLMVSECTNEYNLRATAKFRDNIQPFDYLEYLDAGQLIISIDADGDINLYQSIIDFKGISIANILNNYMYQSEQLRALFIISYSEDKIVGFLLQQLPDQKNNFIDEIERIFTLANTLSKEELLNTANEDLLHKLFNEDDIMIYPSSKVNFSCRCNKDRVFDILRSLGKQEIESILQEQQSIEIACEYCNHKYLFTKDELQVLIYQLSINIEPSSSQIN